MTELSTLAENYKTDKGVTYYNSHGYTEIYDSYFKKFKDENRKIHILEIGVQKGYDLLLMNDYFNGNCEIYGLDIDFSQCKIESFNNIHLIKIDATDHTKLNDLYESYKLDSVYNIPYFDIIIDDGSHLVNDILSSLSWFYNKLSNNGIYIIEDLHADTDILNFLNFNKLNNHTPNIDLNDIYKHIKSCNIYHRFNHINGYDKSICAILEFNKFR